MAERKVTFLINANVKNFTKGMDYASKRFKIFGRDMERIGRSMSQNVSAPLAVISGLAVKSAADFESSFADIRKTVDATEAQFTQMSKELRTLSKTVPTSVNELNKMAGIAGQLGVSTDNIVEFTKTIAMLGDTTDISGEQAALSLSRFMNVMGTDQLDISRLGSTIVGLGNNFAAMESEIIDTAGSLAPLGNSVGLTEQQVLSFATTIAASGGQTEAASTAFQKTANTMKQAVIEGNKDLAIFAKTSGMTSKQFQKAFEDDAGRAIQSFLVGLRRVQKEGGSTASVLEQVGLADQRLIREFGKVLGNLDDLDRALTLSNEEWDNNTALTEEAQKRYQTFNSQLKITFNRINDLGITIGQILLPPLNKLLNRVQGVIEWFSKLSKESQTFALKIAAVAFAIGPTLLVLGKLSKLMAFLISPTFLATAAITALFAGVVTTGQWFVDNWDKIAQGLSNVSKTIVLSFQKMGLGIISAIENVIEFMVNRTPPALLAKVFGINVGDWITDVAGIKEVVGDLAKTVSDGEKELSEGILKYNQMKWGSISDSAKNAFELTKEAIISGLAGILESSQIQSIVDKINSMFTVSVNNESVEEGGFISRNLEDVSPGKIDVRGLAIIPTKLAKVSSGFEQTKKKALDFSDALKSQISSSVISFGETIADVFTGDAGARGFFNNLITLIADFAIQLGKAVVAMGVSALALETLFANPIAAIAAGTALVIAGNVAKNLVAKGPQGMRNGGVVPDGFPNDSYPAMLSSGETVIPAPKPLPSMSMSGRIEVPVYLNDREIARGIADYIKDVRR